MHTHKRRQASNAQLILSLVILAVLFLLALSAISRQAVGEPIMPPRIAQAFNRPQPVLPPGVTYELEIVDPQSLHQVPVLPQVGSVELRLALTNGSALPMSFSFPTAMQCEFTVRQVHEYVGGLFVLPLEVWRSSYFHNISRRPTTLALAPGETKVYVALWSYDIVNRLEVPAGDYRVVADFHGVHLPMRIDKPL